MTASQRLVHIDALRGLAVLLMVLVHAAATWEPSLSGGLLILGVIVSAGGGLAAPLFVALLGWGLAQRGLTRGIRGRLERALPAGMTSRAKQCCALGRPGLGAYAPLALMQSSPGVRAKRVT